MHVAGRHEEARATWLPVAAALLAGVVIGALSFASGPAAILLAALPFVLVAVYRKLTLLAQATLLFCVGVPVLFLGATGGNSANPLLSVPLGSARPPLQVVLPLLMALIALALANGSQLSRLWFVLNHGASGVLSLWVLMAGCLFVYGAANNGLTAAGRDLLYMTTYAWVVVPILLFGRMRERAISLLLPLLVSATTISAALAVLIFAVSPLRSLFVPGTSLLQYTRVGFSTGSAYLLILPVCLLLLARRGTPWRARALAWMSCLLMIAALAMAQQRTAIAVLAVNVVLVVLIPGLGSVGIARARMVGGAIVIGIVIALALVTASLLGYQQARLLPKELSERLTGIVAFSRVDTFQGRAYTNAVAFDRWLATPSTFLRGEGLGAQVRYYDPVTRRAFDEGPFIDNVWAVLAVKGGLVAVGSFAAVLVAAFAAFVRAALSASDPMDRVVWWAIALAFPGLVIATTAMTNHLLAVPALAVTVSTLVAAADLCAQRDVQAPGSISAADASARQM